MEIVEEANSVDDNEEDKKGEDNDEEGQESEPEFENLTQQLSNIAEKFKMEVEEITKLFQQTCCDFGLLE